MQHFLCAITVYRTQLNYIIYTCCRARISSQNKFIDKGVGHNYTCNRVLIDKTWFLLIVRTVLCSYNFDCHPSFITCSPLTFQLHTNICATNPSKYGVLYNIISFNMDLHIILLDIMSMYYTMSVTDIFYYDWCTLHTV